MKLKLKLGRHFLVLGPNDSGKTNAMLYLWTQIPKDVTAVWVDLEEDYDAISKLSDVTVSEVSQLLEALSNGYTRIHFLEQTGNQKTQIAVWDYICQVAFELGQMMVFCDEVMAVCSLFEVTENHYKCLTRGRKRQLSLVQGSQRTQAINKTLVTESHIRICFRLSDYDQNALKPWFPEAHWLRRTQAYSFLIKYPGNGGEDTAVMKPLPLVLPAKPAVRTFDVDLHPDKSATTPVEKLKRERDASMEKARLQKGTTTTFAKTPKRKRA